ncbi:MAG: phospho-N-acetylmuramoyl-pentapeptide-transferase [Actinomycetota bacterium]|jgi:phospho-N-acetylmuramoyl-pentapeptide-transferase|nr:phospho-N-acetylmuramoyl-pentapeptide-transferase [Actinomycetota bacterium]
MTVASSFPTFQVFLAALVAMLITIVLLPLFIRFLHARHIGQQVRADGPQRHLVKQGTPTMGGIIILLSVSITTFLFARPDLPSLLAISATLLTGVLGFVDDVSSVAHARSLGLTPHAKLIGQAAISTLFCLVAVNLCNISPVVTEVFSGRGIDLGVLTTTIPLSDGGIRIPWLYLIFIFLLMAGMSNAVNLTDGLDGLAGGTVMIAMGIMAAIAFRTDQLDMALFAAALAGGCIGFIWFNCYPADIFMGDTGSLALGAALAAIAVMTKTELFSLIIGGIFIIEALSVIIQVVHFKRTRKRVFLMAPLHHHFEKKGWTETKVVIRFWIVTGMFACLGFALFFAHSL